MVANILVAVTTCDTTMPLMSAPALKVVPENMVVAVLHNMSGHTGANALTNVDDRNALVHVAATRKSKLGRLGSFAMLANALEIVVAAGSDTAFILGAVVYVEL